MLILNFKNIDFYQWMLYQRGVGDPDEDGDNIHMKLCVKNQFLVFPNLVSLKFMVEKKGTKVSQKVTIARCLRNKYYIFQYLLYSSMDGFISFL